MYIIELYYKLKEKFKKRGKTVAEVQDDNQDETKCEHIFVPVDSTNTILGCNKCGFLIHVDPKDLEKKNIFE